MMLTFVVGMSPVVVGKQMQDVGADARLFAAVARLLEAVRLSVRPELSTPLPPTQRSGAETPLLVGLLAAKSGASFEKITYLQLFLVSCVLMLVRNWAIALKLQLVIT